MSVSRRLLIALLCCLPCPLAFAQSAAQPMGATTMIAGHFRLTTPDGKIVDSSDLSGKLYALFFGFTSCPNLCPTTLADLSAALAKLPVSAKNVRVYFITVDPEHDSQTVLAQYMASFDPRIVALTGARPEVDEAIRSFGIVARRDDLGGGRYTYSHTAAVFLIDGDGLIVDRIGADLSPTAVSGRLASLAGAASPSVP